MSRKLDAAIAEALGYEVFWVGEGMQKEPRYKSKKCGSWSAKPVPHYSTDGNDMLRLEEEVYKRRHVLDVSRYGKTWGVTWWSTLKGEGKVEVESADTMPEAVAMAAYRAITGKEW
jgi:hypothetical protein